MSREEQIIKKIEGIMKQPKYHVENPNRRADNMWKVEKFTKDGVTLLIMDEGHSRMIVCKELGVEVLQGKKGLRFTKGGVEELERVLKTL